MKIYYCPQHDSKTQFQTFLLYTYCSNTYPKGRALIQMYRVVPITKRGNSYLLWFNVHRVYTW